MLTADPDKLALEIEASEVERDRRINLAKDLIQGYAGHGHSPDNLRDADLENHAYEFISLVLPNWIFADPVVRVQLGDMGAQQEKAVETAMNQWIRTSEANEEFISAAYDAAFAFGVLMTVREPVLGFDMSDPESPWLPRVYRIDPTDFGFDHRTRDFTKARYSYVRRTLDKELLLEEAKDKDSGWNKSAIDRLIEDGDVGHGIDWANPVGWSKPKDTDRQDIFFYEIWIPELFLEGAPGPDQGFHGSIVTISTQEGGIELREPRPYFGPPWGPFTMLGLYAVPNSPWPLSPLAATAPQSKMLNMVSSAIADSARNYKKMELVDSQFQGLAQKLASSPHEFILPVEDFDAARSKGVEIGGVTSQQLAQRDIMREQMDRNSGINDAQRGNISGKGSATEVAVAEAGGTKRLMFQQNRFRRGVRLALKTVSWYLINDTQAIMPLDQQSGGGVFVGSSEPNAMISNEVVVNLDAHSMKPITEDEEKQKALMEAQVLQTVAPLVTTMPWVNWQDVLDDIGSSWGIRGLSEKINWQLAMAVAGMSLQATGGLGAAPPSGGGGQGGRPPGQTVVQGQGLPGRETGAKLAAEVKKR